MRCCCCCCKILETFATRSAETAALCSEAADEARDESPEEETLDEVVESARRTAGFFPLALLAERVIVFFPLTEERLIVVLMTESSREVVLRECVWLLLVTCDEVSECVVVVGTYIRGICFQNAFFLLYRRHIWAKTDDNIAMSCRRIVVTGNAADSRTW